MILLWSDSTRNMIGATDGSVIADLGIIGGTSGDITFNNSLQIGVQKILDRIHHY